MYRLMPFSRRALTAAAVVSSLVAAPRLTLAQAACGAGETVLRAGDARLASFTPISADSFEMTMEREGATRSFGTYTQHVARTTIGGAPALLFVQRSSTPRGTALDSIWVDARTWAPLRHFEATPVGGVDVTYRGGRVTGRVTSGDTVRAVDAALPEGSFDNSVGNAALVAVPLCEGAVVRVVGYDAARGQRETVFHVLGSDRVEIGGEMRDVWVTDATVGERTVRIHIDRATGRELAWSSPGPGGATLRGTSRIFNTR